MSSLSKIIAVLLLIAGLGLAGAAWHLLSVRPETVPAAALPEQAPPPAPEAAGVLHPVIVAARPIPAGSRLEAAQLTLAHWPAVPQGAFVKAGALEGEVARVDIGEGEPLLPSMLARGLSRQLKNGERAVAVAVDEVAGVGNRVAPGDTVDVFFELDKGAEVKGTQARLLQAGVRVLAYGDAALGRPDPGVPAKGGAAPVPRTAVLAMPVADVNSLLLASRSGRLRLALRPAGDDGQPDVTLFAARQPVLPGRPDLSPAQRAALGDGLNRAYAGDSLAQLDGAADAPRPAAAATARSGRSVEILRGGQSERVRY